MKKLLIILTAGLLLTACDDNELGSSNPMQDGVTFNVPDFVNESGTRVDVAIDANGANFSWSEGDTLGVFPLNGYQTAFPISGGAGSNTASFDGADWALKPYASYAAYYPFQRSLDFDKDSITVSYLGQVQNGNGSTAHIGEYDYLASSFQNVSSNGNVIFPMVHLGSLLRFQFALPIAGTYSKMVVRSAGSIPMRAYYELSQESASLRPIETADSLVLCLSNISTTKANEEAIFYMMVAPGDYSKDVWVVEFWNSSNETTSIYSYITKGPKAMAGCVYNIKKNDSNVTGTHNGHPYVDLGLTNGVAWATVNIGATQIIDNGSYFSWGETVPYGNEDRTNENNILFNRYYDWYTYGGICEYIFDYEKKYFYPFTYKHYKTHASKYNLDSTDPDYDGKRVIDLDNDPVYTTWTGQSNSWWYSGRMPSKEECQELIDYCNWEWTSLNNVNGYKVTGPNSQSIFLPAAGYQLVSVSCEVGQTCTYWTNEVKNNTIDAYSLTMSEDGRKEYSMDNRCYRKPIRPVTQYYGNSNSVDLGLPSGIKWSSCNWGADSPSEFGTYVEWGFCNDCYPVKYCTNSSFPNRDNKTQLDPEDDAAAQNWSGNWKMPTYEEYLLLRQESKWIYTDNLNGLGKKGFILLGLKDGYRDRYLFFPFAGVCYSETMTDYSKFNGYWTSSLYEENSECAQSIFFKDFFIRPTWATSGLMLNRYNGLPVRPVLQINK